MAFEIFIMTSMSCVVGFQGLGFRPPLCTNLGETLRCANGRAEQVLGGWVSQTLSNKVLGTNHLAVQADNEVLHKENSSEYALDKAYSTWVLLQKCVLSPECEISLEWRHHFKKNQTAVSHPVVFGLSSNLIIILIIF